jgi:hypothetical protein
MDPRLRGMTRIIRTNEHAWIRQVVGFHRESYQKDTEKLTRKAEQALRMENAVKYS